MDVPEPVVCRVRDLPRAALVAFLTPYGLRLQDVAEGVPIPASYWGAPEAGIEGHVLHARADTPIHSLLHTACHFICMGDARRATVHTDAGGDDLEESAVCYLQCVLADALPGFSRARMFADMDAWGYSFRLGSAKRWFEADADDARAWLRARGLI